MTESHFNVSQDGGQEQEADPWILARSFLTFKIGKSGSYVYPCLIMFKWLAGILMGDYSLLHPLIFRIFIYSQRI